MKTITVKTGFGYIKNSKGEVVSRCELPEGEHPINEEFEYIECETKEAMELIEIAPERPTADQVNERKIQEEVRAMAIERLQSRGEI